MLTLAAHVLKVEKASLRIDDGVVSSRNELGGNRSVCAELGKIAYGNQALLPQGFEPGWRSPTITVIRTRIR